MGYHSGTSDTVPDKFICFDCRVHADQNWDLIMVHNLYPRMMAKFRDLALFRCVVRSDRLAMLSQIPIHRRAIKICETQNPESLSAFTKSVGKSCGSANIVRYFDTHSYLLYQAVKALSPASCSSNSKPKVDFRSALPSFSNLV